MKPISAQTRLDASVTTETSEVILNPVTGDRMTILHSLYTNGGTYAKFRFDLPPGASGSPLHYHTRMSETFTVLAGNLEMEVGRKGNRRTLQAGDSLHVPPGMHHSFRNASNEWVTFTSENRPAAGFERFIRGMFGLAIDGKVNHEGMPTNLLHLALLLKHGDIVLVGLSPRLQRLLISTLVYIAHLLRVDRSLLQYWHVSDRSHAS
ncbi:MAG: cupin domain-containing protein [Stenomitos rutilans HA7619-LM2]|jgi:quercetin dioxygenase-like cupin family protein|nr:cupin domain-containing protein [Stenomitos rutilans HA7619-LM2]